MPKKTTLRGLQDRLNDLLGARTQITNDIDHTKQLIDLRRESKKKMAQARRLAEKHDIDIEEDDGDWWVTHPDLLDTGSDPLAGNHFCTTAHEVLEAVQAYADHFAKT